MAARGPEYDTMTAGPAETRATVTGSGVTPPCGPRLEIPRGTFIDRYVVLDEIGAGGMGVVFKALDPELERRVAIKLLRPSAGDQSTAGRARLVREGQAIAQLSHPNVIAVHDIGLFRDDLFFVAMEYVEGRSLRDWLKQERRELPEILEVFAQAGRGLAAAHAKGLIHRDFKPDNVLLGDDGRVRVVDFGLARSQQDSPLEEEFHQLARVDGDSSASGRLDTNNLTRTGDVMGTPAYMAPEQFRGEVGDARTDQFSFCVALYRALTGRSPFGRPTCELLPGDTAEPAHPMPPEAQVPGWLERLILRGLQREPDQRHPSMDELLAELERDRGVKRSTWLLGGSVFFTALAVGLGATLLSADEPQLCRGGDDRFATVWNADVRTRMERVFVATGRPYAGDAFARVSEALTDYRDGWVGMYTEACEATHVQGAQSSRLLDLRMTCLDRRLSEVDALVGLFATELAPRQLDKAVQAAYGLTSLDGCADRESLEAVVPPPDPQTTQRVATLRGELDRAFALQNTGAYGEGLAVAEQVAQEAAATGYAPLEAEAQFRLGTLQQRNGDPKEGEQSLYRAMQQAALGRDHRLVTRALVELMWVVGYQQGRHEGGIAFYEAARATGSFGELYVMDRVHMLRHMGVLLVNMGRYEEGLPYHQQVLELIEAQYDEHHPFLATALNNVGTVYAMQGKSAQSIEYFKRALAIGERTLGREHPYVTDYLSNIGEMLNVEEKYEEGRPYLQRAVAALERTLSPDHPDIAYPLTNMADGYAEQGRCDEALPHYRRSLALRERALGADNPHLAYPLLGIGRCLVDQGQPAAALPELERALTLFSTGDPNPRAYAQFLLARALWEADGDRPRAVALAREAQESWQSAEGSRWDRQRALVDTWLRAHDG